MSVMGDARDDGDADAWWRTAVIYQVYIRSFRDGDGDGIGDIAGIRERLPYLRDLGVDAIWITPWYPSPMADGGYDVADYCGIDPAFGTVDAAQALIGEAHQHGLRVLLDIVPNHTSSEHAWFRAALAAAPGSPERARYVFRPGRGEDGTQPPTDWRSVFGGPAWTRTTNADGTPDDWYLHLFAPEQPDLDWTHPAVHAELERVLRFWFDRGVDGFRIDVAHGLVKDQAFPDLDVGADETLLSVDRRADHPYWDLDGVHDIYRAWRRIADSYDPPRVFVAEAWVRDGERLARYLRSDELHTAFNFDYLAAGWHAERLRTVIDESIATAASVDAPPTWVMSNHDVVRHVSRFGRPDQTQGGHSLGDVAKWGALDLELGRRRARAALLLMLALPGSAYVYQGEELGLEEVEDLPESLLQDPTWERSGHTERGRDGCRVPLPWGDEHADVPSWLPRPSRWTVMSAACQESEATSMLELYRAALRVRRKLFANTAPLRWNDTAADVLSFTRGDVTCIVNFGSDPIELPAGRVLVTSSPSVGTSLGMDEAAWLVTT